MAYRILTCVPYYDGCYFSKNTELLAFVAWIASFKNEDVTSHLFLKEASMINNAIPFAELMNEVINQLKSRKYMNSALILYRRRIYKRISDGCQVLSWKPKSLC